jgi:hypothetical protein
MKKSISILVFCCFFTINKNFAQRSMLPLVGNGNEKTVNYDLKSFDMLDILWVGGNIEVEFGASTSDISIVSDENLFNLLEVKNSDGLLRLEMKNNYKNRLWLEDSKTRIKIRTTSQPRQIVFKANANATMRGINASILGIDKDENGNLTLLGKVDILNIEKQDNGNIEAQQLVAEQASINARGNGTVSINAKRINKKSVSGNGGLWNIAAEKAF